MDSHERIARYKLILFGNEGVGKTSLVERFVNDKFEENYISTLGYNVYEKRILYDDWIISLLIYDIGGQEKFNGLRKKYAEGASTAFILYDITDPTSFSNLLKWRNDLISYVGFIPFIIIGNKVDLKEEREIQKDDVFKMASILGALACYETSAKTGKGVEDAFYHLAILTYECYIKSKFLDPGAITS